MAQISHHRKLLRKYVIKQCFEGSFHIIIYYEYRNATGKRGVRGQWLRSLTSNHLPLISVGLNPDFGFFHVRKLSS
jgi:hypothetical protein